MTIDAENYWNMIIGSNRTARSFVEEFGLEGKPLAEIDAFVRQCEDEACEAASDEDAADIRDAWLCRLDTIEQLEAAAEAVAP